MLFRSVYPMNVIQPMAPNGIEHHSLARSVLDDVNMGSPLLQQQPPHQKEPDATPTTDLSDLGQEVLYREYAQSFEMERSESTSLQIITADGDKITLNMSSEWQRSASREATVTDSEQSYSIHQQSYQGYNIQYQVEGELDEGELKALDDVMGQLSEVASDFFSGNLAGAISELSTFEMDTSEFTNLSMEMRRSVSYSMVESYREVSEMMPSSVSTGGHGGLHELSDFVQSMLDMIDNVEELLERINKPEEFVGGLMEQAIERDPRSQLFQNDSKSQIHDFLGQVAAVKSANGEF